MVLDLISASYIGWPNPAFVIRSFDTARVVQGERRAELARAMLSRSPHLQSISLMLCKGTTFFVRFQISPLDLGRFSARIHRIDVFNIEPACAQQTHASMALNSLNRSL